MERDNIGMQDAYPNRQKEELTPGELSAALGVSTMTISRWRARGCPYREACPNYTRKSASRPRYNLAEVKAWIKEQQRNSQAEERRIILENINSEKFDNDRSAIEAKTSLSATEFADMLNAAGYLYGVPRREKARAWEGDNVSRIYFGKDYITIKDGVITNRNLHKVRACTACDDAMNAVKIILESQAEDLRSARTDAPTDPAQEWLAPIKQKFLEARKAGASMADLKQMLLTMHPNTKALARAFANNILAGFAGESEEVTAAGSNDDSRRRKEPIEMPDGTKCYTENCERHDNEEASENETIAEIEIDFEFSKEGNWRDEFIEFYKNELAGKAVVVENTGHTIAFLNSGSAARLAAKGVRNQKRAETGKKLKEAISKANIKSVEPTTHKERESKKRTAMIESNDLYYTFATPIKINGRKHEVLIYALHGKDNKDEKALRFYEFSVSEK